jgi:hypothetical protein
MPLRSLPRLAIVAIGFVTAASTVNLLARADDSARTAHESALLDRIFANWKARQDRAHSIHFTWDSRALHRKGSWEPATNPPTRLDRDLETQRFGVQFWMDGDGSFCLIDTPLFKSPPAKLADTRRVTFRAVSVGKTTITGSLPDNSGHLNGRPSAARGQVFNSFTIERVTPTPDFQALLLTFRPEHPSVHWRKEQCRVVSENSIVDGGHYLKLRRVLDQHRSVGAKATRYEEECWVDPARDDVVVHWAMPTIEGSIKYQKDKTCGWVPSEWTWEARGGNEKFKVTNYAINEKLDPATFSLAFPAGTVVVDTLDVTSEEAIRRYVVQPDGSKKMISVEEWMRLWDLPQPRKRPLP